MSQAWLLPAALLVPATLLYGLGALRVRHSSRTDAALMLLPPWGALMLVRYWSARNSPRWLLIAAFVLLALALAVLRWGLPAVPEEDGFQMPAAPAPMSEQDEEEDEEAALRRSIVLSALVPRRGRIELLAGKVVLELPPRFRFVEREGLSGLEGEDAPSDSTLGWIVHDSVDLAAAGAWHVVVDRVADGYIVANESLLADDAALAQRARRVLRRFAADSRVSRPAMAGYAEAPAWDAQRSSVTWVEHYQAPAAGELLECYAARLDRRGALVFSANAMASSRQELCTRSVRLLAARVVHARGERYEDHGMLDLQADYDVGALVSGEYLLP